MTSGTIAAVPAGFSSAAIHADEPQFTPKIIGERAKEVADRRFVQSPDTATRVHQFNTLKALLQHIRNIPLDAPAGLSIKNNALTVKLPNGGHQPLIEGFRSEPDYNGPIDALSALRLTQNEKTRGSRIERLRCTLSSVGNRLIGRDTTHIRAERLALDRHTLERSVNQRLKRLIFTHPSYNGILPHGDIAFIRQVGTGSLEHFDLKGMPLHELDLRQADLGNKNLSGCSLPLDLTGVDLRGSQLYGVALGRPSAFHDYLSRERTDSSVMSERESSYEAFAERRGRALPDFAGALMTGAKLTMPLPFQDRHGIQSFHQVIADELKQLGAIPAGELSEADHRLAHANTQVLLNEMLDREYNHLTNTRSGSLLTSIHSIGDLTLKKELMEDCVAYLMKMTSPQERASIREPLTDILFNRDYLDPASEAPDSHIRKLANELIDHHFATGDTRLLDLTSLTSIDTSVFLKEHISRAEILLSMYSTNERKLKSAPAAFCQQLIQASARIDDTVLRDRALTLQQSIFRLPAHAHAVNNWSEVLGYDDSDAVELGEIATFRTSDDKSVVMTGRYYRTFIQNIATDGDDLGNPESEIALFARSRQENIGQDDNSQPAEYIGRNEFLRQFLTPAFTDIKMTSRLGLDLGLEYQRRFAEAGRTAVYRSEKLTSPEHKLQLRKIVEPHLEEHEDEASRSSRHMKVADTYVANVLTKAPIPCRSKLEQGYYLLCVSAIFTNYSSSRQFGEEFDSPESLRELAAGLLDSASARLPHNTVPGGELMDLRDRLLGNGNAFTCTAVAYNRINATLRQLSQQNPQLKPIYEAIMPPTWR